MFCFSQETTVFLRLDFFSVLLATIICRNCLHLSPSIACSSFKIKSQIVSKIIPVVFAKNSRQQNVSCVATSFQWDCCTYGRSTRFVASHTRRREYRLVWPRVVSFHSFSSLHFPSYFSPRAKITASVS